MSSSSSRVAIVTGAAGGIGAALVSEFFAHGYSVIATDIAPQAVDMKCESYVEADLSRAVIDDSYASELFSQLRALIKGRGLHALINNAATQILGGVDALQRKDWHQTLNVNLLAPFFLTQAMLPELEFARGCVINISSIHARLTKKNFVAYATSKAALSGMTRAMAVDLQDRVRVNAIEPAAIETEMLKAGFNGRIDQYLKLTKCHPSQRIGNTSEVARLAIAVAGGDLRFLHGTNIGLDGGISCCLMDPSTGD